MSDMYGFWTCGVYGLPVRFGTAGEHCCDDANILQRAIKKSHHKIHVITPLSSLRQGGHGRVSATGTATELPGSFVLFKFPTWHIVTPLVQPMGEPSVFGNQSVNSLIAYQAALKGMMGLLEGYYPGKGLVCPGRKGIIDHYNEQSAALAGKVDTWLSDVVATRVEPGKPNNYRALVSVLGRRDKTTQVDKEHVQLVLDSLK